MKIDIEGVKIPANLAESITARTLKKHIKLLDELATDAFFAGFSAKGDYIQVSQRRDALEEALEYFSE